MHSPFLFGAIYHIDKIDWQIIFALCAIFFAPVNCDTVSGAPVGESELFGVAGRVDRE
jgi:hypothetical protein